jgi:thiamine-monophosphate kinase
MNEKKILDQIPEIFHQTGEVFVGPGDDCAVLDFGLDKLYLMAVDQLVSDVHYVKSSAFAAKIAKKLLNRNLSDIAAMGGLPAQALLAITLCRDTAEDKYWIKEFLESIESEARRWNVSICGGDISSTNADSDSFSLTITGWVAKESLCLRSSAKPGDLLFATGCFGNSFSTGHHLNFSPRIEQGQFLAGSFTNTMIDVSDGLLLDSARLAEMSNLGLSINPENIQPRGKASVKKRLTDGEDYELLFSLAPEKVELLLNEWPFDDIPLSEVGVFTNEDRGIVKNMKGDTLYGGGSGKFTVFDHLI